MEEYLKQILTRAVEQDVSDVFVVAGFPLAFKTAGSIAPQDEKRLGPQDSEALILALYRMAGGRNMENYLKTGDDDFSFSLAGVGRFRVNAYRQRGSMAAVIRVVSFGLPDPNKLNIPAAVVDLYQLTRGLVLVTGPAGSGKSTTLSCMIDQMNRNCEYHIITIEDPIEFLYRNDRCIVSQREINQDTSSFVQALRFALRQAPNVILLGEMRDYETISTAMTAAETGQLVLSTLHTVGAAKTIDRIIDVFPANRQQQMRVQLSMVLQAVVSQQLIPTLDGGLVPAFEIMIVNNAIRNLIRENKIYQINNVIFSSGSAHMVTMDSSIFSLYQQKRISAEHALLYSTDIEAMRRKIGQ